MQVFAGQIDLPSVHFAVRNFLSSNLNEGEYFVMGLEDRLMFDWYYEIKGTWLVQPYFKTFEEFNRYLKEKKVKYVVVAAPTIKSFPEIYDNYFRLSYKSRLDYFYEEKRPSGWELVFKYPIENSKNFKVLIYNVESLWKN